MLSTIRYFISTGLLLVSCICFSQEKQGDKKPIKPRKDFSPTGIRVGTDLIDLGKSFSGKDFQGWEINGDIDFANYYLTADIGNWSKNIALPNGYYTNGGNYFRIGVDINLLGKDPDKNMFFFGFRYAHSQFHESLRDTVISAGLFPVLVNQVDNGNVSGGWAEITSGLRVKIWKGLWMGYTARMKFAPTINGSTPSMSPYDMPGYGIVSQKPWWGFNYQIFWRFAWKKQKPVEKK